MRDKRPVDELSIEELERILAIRKREARQARLGNYEKVGRRVGGESVDLPPEKPAKIETKAAVIALAPEPELVPVLTDGIVDDGTPRFEDDPIRREVIGERRTAKLRDRVLLGVEIVATVGIIYLLFSLFQSLQQFTDYTAQVNAQAQGTAMASLVTPTATPVINFAGVLPSGHSFDPSGQAVFNMDEIPAQYRGTYQTQLEQPYAPPTSSPEGASLIEIPAINVRSQVVEGDSWQALQTGVGHHVGSANPGQSGNLVLSAHDDVFGEIFKNLDKLQPGDKVTVYTLTQNYTYIVQTHRIVEPSDTSVLDSQGAGKQLTLISCYPYRKDTQRIVVFATLQE